MKDLLPYSGLSWEERLQPLLVQMLLPVTVSHPFTAEINGLARLLRYHSLLIRTKRRIPIISNTVNGGSCIRSINLF
jgi:hypothetical protein